LIEKFNFYDIYGYFLPGAVLVSVLWIPLGLVRNRWPSSTWTSAIIAIAIAYIAGHLVQTIATNALPASDKKSSSNRNRGPSEILLDPKEAKDEELPRPLKDKIAVLVQNQFGLDLKLDVEGDDVIDKARNSAFLCARQILIQGKAISYAEQFQGMYALMRGLACAFAIGFAYWLGWVIAVFKYGLLVNIAVLIVAVSFLAMGDISLFSRKVGDPVKKRKHERAYAALALIAFLAIGFALGVRYNVTAGQSAILAFLAASSLLACLRAHGAYRSFAWQFAGTVWRDYVAFNAAASLRPKSESETK
jgi:hypothetical protein